MNRFKFRVFSKSTQKLLMPDISDYWFDSLGDIIEDEDCILEQCTGLKDKNEKLIYEHDILKDHRGDICVVMWNSELASFMLYKTDMKSIYSPIDTDITNFEIIGNINENPELLEDK